ncbi:uncharacterized protein [Physcomitrium patens]
MLERKTPSCSRKDKGVDEILSHNKSTMFGSSITIPITDGVLNIGKWQVICLMEHNGHGSCHRMVVTMTGI